MESFWSSKRGVADILFFPLEIGEYLQFNTSVYDCILGFVFYCSECVVISQEILKNEEAMYLQMIEQPSELEGLQQGRQAGDTKVETREMSSFF